MLTITELKDRIYQDFISSFKNAITPLKKSFFEQMSNSLAGTFLLSYIYLNNISKDSYLTSCTEDRVVDYFAPLKNVTLKLATKSVGVIRLTGNDGDIVPSGTTVTYNSLEFTTIEDGTVSSGYIDINSESVETGTVTNTLSNIDMFLTEEISGIDNKCISLLGFSGAIDDELIESVRTRTKQKFATATNIDNDNNYKSLANEVDNIKATFISSIKNGKGTFGVTCLVQSGNGVPTQADIDNIEQHFINNEAIPTYVECEYFIPTIVYQDLDILLAVDSDDNKALVTQLVKDYMYLFQKPSKTFAFSGLATYLQTQGARLTDTTNITLASDEVLDLGTITWL